MQTSMMLFSWLKIIEQVYIPTSFRGRSDKCVFRTPISMSGRLFLGDRIIACHCLHALFNQTVTQSPLKSKLAKDIVHIADDLIKTRYLFDYPTIEPPGRGYFKQISVTSN
jgi:hypothetical protein